MLRTTTKQPDILEVIADLSSDEVFTPPRIANAVLDLLPEDVWSNPELRVVDPGTKTGVFLREATKRFMMGLKEAIPDEDNRLSHILQNQVFGIAITELTSLMARRTLYCSKTASGPKSTVTMATPNGRVWFERVEHLYDSNGKCSECAASRTQMERDNRENYAYGFIHGTGRAAIQEELGMQFDVIVGNPPYQMESQGSNRTMPIYNAFVEQAKALNPRYMAMIIPSRWMASGLGLGSFRSEMLGDKRIRTLLDYPDASEVFPGVDIKSGVCYFLWDRDNPGPCSTTLIRGSASYGPTTRNLDEHDVLIRDSRALPILNKVLGEEEPSIVDVLSVDKEFGLTSNFKDYSRKQKPGLVPLFAYNSGKRITGWVSREAIEKSSHLIDSWKVLIPAAGPGNSGGQTLPDIVLGSPRVAPSPSACTQTYLFVYVDSEDEAHSVESYVRTRFFRFLISLRKVSQHATRSTYKWVPQQSWDRQWTDEALFAKYRITADEQAYISEMIREMPA